MSCLSAADTPCCLCADANKGTATYISFQFAQPQEDGAKAVTGLNFSEGKLVCKVRHPWFFWVNALS